MQTTLLKFLAIIFFITIKNLVLAQTCTPPITACTNTPFNGSLNLINTLYTFSKQSAVSYAKSPLPNTFGDVKYVGDDNYADGTSCDTSAGAVDSCFDTSYNLIYDVYYPSNYSNYSTCPLPAVILFHAGGFMECSNYAQPGIRVVCEELAKRGYVAFSVEYRAGRIKDPNTVTVGIYSIGYTSVQQQLAVYRACQDARGAIRSIIQRARDGTYNSLYRIDTSSLFIGGFSAGGVAAMNSAWYTNNMVYQVFPAATGSATIQQALTSINADFYYGASTIDYQSKIKGTAAMWTAISIPPSYDTHEYDFFNSALLKPQIAFQGKLDNVFYYDDGDPRQGVYFSPTPSFGPNIYNSEDFCVRTNNGAYTLEGTSTTVDLINGSCLNMRNILNHYGIANELYVDCDMHHGLTSNGVFEGDFGTSATNSNQASVYIAQRIATFFQAILSSIQGSIGTDYFPNCENTRYGCTAKTTSCTDCN